MAKQVIGHCPICQSKLKVAKLVCTSCQTELAGEFELSAFDYLSREQLAFIIVYIKNQGNIKAIEKELGVSYPTVKKLLDEVITALGYKVEENPILSRYDVLAQLKSGKIDFEEAERLLKEID